VITGGDALLYIIAGEEANAYDCERRSVCVSVREEANVYDCERRSAHASAREEAHVLSHELLI
jgi:hypothetical protein